MKTGLTSVELFTGAGGLALGLECAGFEPCALVEYQKDACQTLRYNRPEWNVLQNRVQEVDFSEYEGVDLVAGGPPCQPFSIGGKAKGYNDRRDGFPEAVRAVREIQPKAFIFENVRGLLRPAFQSYVEYIRLQLCYPDFPLADGVEWFSNLQRLEKHHTSAQGDKSLCYNVTLHLANAADYGVPQRRHRVFFIGFRADIAAEWAFPAPTHTEEELLFEKFVTANYWREHGVCCQSAPERLKKRILRLSSDLPLFRRERWRTVRDALKGLPEPDGPTSIANHRFQPGARAYPGHTGSPLDEPSKALKAGDHGVPGGENMLCDESGQVRYFSIRESARLQAFPDDYLFPGSWTESMRQLGNAVPVLLARKVASSVYEKILTCDARKTCF